MAEAYQAVAYRGSKIPNLYKRGPSFYLRVSHEGKLKWFKLKALAVQDAVRERDQFFSSPVQERITTNVRLREHWDAVLEYQTSPSVPAKQRWSDRTRVLYTGLWLSQIKPVLGEMRVSDITARDVDRVFDRMRSSTYTRGKTARPYSESSIRNAYVVLSMLFREAQKARFGPLVAHSPMKGATLPEGPSIGAVLADEILTPEEVEALAGATSERFAMFFRLAAATGMRLSEGCGLLWTNLDLERGLLTLTHQLRTVYTEDEREGKSLLEPGQRLAPLKGRKDIAGSQSRELWLSPTMVAQLREYRQWAMGKGQYRKDGFVFATRAHTPIGQDNVKRALALAVGQVGLTKPAGSHAFRHAFASQMFAAGAVVEEVQHALGHASPDVTTKRYVRLIQSDQRRDRWQELLARAGM